MKSIKSLFVLILFQFIIAHGLFAQNISGVINVYTKVTAVTCSSITVASASGFKAGDTVMIIAMKGAYADTVDNTNKFGHLINYNTVGNYEIDLIKSVVGNTINLQSGLIRQYNPSTTSVQLIRVPYYKNATVTAKLTAAPWNGVTGGVLALQVEGTLTLNAHIDVSGLGFRGGIYSVVSGTQQDTLYYYTYVSGHSGGKGEGIADSGAYFETGRGNLVNAAGGGDGHNSGGGGGGNFGHGGVGGDQWGGYGKLANGGIGGDTLTYSNAVNRIFMGGGGGGPHQNNNQATKGTNGGGIIYIGAASIVGNGDSIMANGLSVKDTSGLDGAGGAGAGGAIVLNVPAYTTALYLTARGGHGGLANCWYNDCIGTGGGGGGGAVWVSPSVLPPNVISFLEGGNPGLDINNSSGGCYMSPYGADTGKPGGIVYGLKPPISTPPYVVLSAPCSSSGTKAYVSGGGTPPYSYVWAPGGQTTDTVTGLAPGTYTVTFKDNCGIDSNIIFSVSTGITSVSVTSKSLACANDSNGVAYATVTGGAAPYTYSWSPIGGTGDTATHLSSGTYTVTITDAAGCKVIDSITISQPSPLTVTAKAISASCGKSNGSAVAVTSGGTKPYTYLWSPSSQTSDTASSLAAGIFSVTVTDSNGCSTVKALTIVGDSGIAASISHFNVKCFGDSNGKATAVVSGGTGPFSYSWAGTGNTNATDSTLHPGTYTVYVTDINSCVAIDTVTIGQPTQLKATITSVTNVLCNGDTSGSATAAASGGTNPYSYAWSPSGGTSTTAKSIGAGIYTVSVTDKNGCKATDTVTIHQPTAVRDSISSFANVLCNGGTTGTATVGVKNGTGPYTYVWSSSQTTATVSGLGAGTYTVTVKDKNNCSSKVTVTITQPAAIKDSLVATNVKCNGGNNGSAWVITGGGTKPYTYSWSPSSGTKDTISNLTAGSYTVSIKDSNGCKATGSIAVTQPPAITITTSSTPTDCDTTNGTGTASASGGASPYTYSWSSGASGATAGGLGIGTYTVTVTDANGCKNSATVTVAKSPSPTISVTSSPTACDTTNGTATATASGGTSPYSYSWSSGSTSTTANGLGTGTYTITVTDAHGCSAASSVSVSVTPSPTLVMSSVASKCDSSTGSATATASGGAGPYIYNWSPGSGTGTTISDLAPGQYTVVVKNKNVCTSTDTITVKRTGPPVITISSTSPICRGDSAVITATGGGKYLWSTGATTSSITVKPTTNTTYTVTVNNGCVDSASTTVMVDNTSITVCCDTTIGSGSSAFVRASGATGYVWSPQSTVDCYTCAATTVTPTTTGQTTYTVIGTDSNGCKSFGYVTIDVTCASFTVPNVFTPNSDGKNDVFLVKAVGTQSYSIIIYDRWGKEIYSSNDPATPWDGKNKNGVMVSDGVYYYIIKSTCNSVESDYHGFVQVIKGN